jgi:hypothetical protein
MSCAPVEISPPRKKKKWEAVSSYDSGYEHSLEHVIEVKNLVDGAEAEAAPETKRPPRTLAAAGGC